MARVAAAVIALAAWARLAVQFGASLSLTGAVGTAVWVMLRYFTVIANLFVAIVMTGIALRSARLGAPWLLGGTTLAILLVGAVYGLLLRGLVELSGGAKVADVLLHYVTPVLTPLFWLAYRPRGGLRRRDPWIWTAFPGAYFIYALARGAVEGVYAYPFMDVGKLGWARTAAVAAVIMVGFVFAGHILLWIDRGRVARAKPA